MSIAASPNVAPKMIAISGGQAVAPTSSIAMPDGQQPAPTVAVDLGRYNNAITIPSANVSLARPSSGPTSNPVHGGGGVSTPGATNSGVDRSIATAGPTAPTNGQGQAATVQPVPVDAAATTQGDGDGAIRPMALRPSATKNAGPVVLRFQADSTSNPPASNHDISLSVNGYAIIGAPFSANVAAINNSPQFKQVVWQATGAVQSENYVNSLGSFTLQPTVIDKFGGQNQPPVQSFDNFGSYWGNTPGQQTVTVTATFTDGVSATEQMSVNVVAPTVDSFVVTSTPFAWGPVSRETFSGLTVQTPISYEASVTMPDSGGQSNSGGWINMIQKVDSRDTVTNLISGPHVSDTNGLVLDTDDPDPAGKDYLYGVSTHIEEAQTGDFSDTDEPWTSYIDGTDPASGKFDGAIEVKTTITLEDHLVFQPDNGIWVNLATSAPIVMTGDESYNIATGKWSDVVAPTPGGTGVMPTNQDYNIVTWTNWYGNVQGKWNPAYPPNYN